MEIRHTQELSSITRIMEEHISNISGLLNLRNSTEKELLWEIWKECYKSNNHTAIIIKDVKEDWAKKLQCSLGTINNTITTLLVREVIISNARSVYIMNPKYFFNEMQGDTFRFEIEYISLIDRDARTNTK